MMGRGIATVRFIAAAALVVAAAACGPETRGNAANRCFSEARARIWLAPAAIGGGLVGISLRDQGQPVANATVVIAQQGRPGKTTIFTGPDGIATIADLDPGAYRTEVYHQSSHIMFHPVRVAPWALTVVHMEAQGSEDCAPFRL
jgi:hypothetical protein